ncbi:MAG: uroporphyrinogen decarboxylase family protein [bacterium]
MNNSFPHIPLTYPTPDSQLFIDLLMGKQQGHTPLIEYIVDDFVMKSIHENLLERRWVAYGNDRESQKAYLDNFIEFWYRMGYDFVRFEQSLPFLEPKLLTLDTAPGATTQRQWADEHHGYIRNWEEFERYPWPRVDEFDFFPFEYLNANLPEGMGLVSSHGGGVFEHVTWIMSLEGFCYSLVEDPALAKAVIDRIGEMVQQFYKHILGLDRLIAVFPGDDMGHYGGTIISPDDLRTLFLPWVQTYCAMSHARGLPFFLHSCGNLLAIMDDLIGTVNIDGKHSYEDKIIPVQDFQERYGLAITVLGGLDLNILAGAPAMEVRQKTSALITQCGSRGRYAIGSGNSVPSYVPVENYLAMIDEAMKLKQAS